MYEIDALDAVAKIDIPQMDTGAPEPRVYRDDRNLHLTYRLSDDDSADLSSDPNAADRFISVRFEHPRAHYLGPPNDETLHSHPLHERGLEWYGVYEIRDSSWIRTYERRNSVHPMHKPGRFAGLKHFVFAFHDETFECIAEGLAWRIEPARPSPV